MNKTATFKISTFKRIIALTFAIASLILPGAVLAQSATLTLTPSSGTFNKGCSFSLDVRLDTGSAQTDGTDAIIEYDLSRLTATSITSGSIYSDYPNNNICENNPEFCPGIGRVSVSGLSTSAFSGQGSLAVVNFTVKDNAPTGVTQVTFDFTKSETTDSNVVQKGTASDILSSVTNGSYTIGTGSCGTLPATGTGGQGAIATPSAEEPEPFVPVKTLPSAGSEQLTFTLAIVGSVLTILGILGIALL